MNKRVFILVGLLILTSLGLAIWNSSHPGEPLLEFKGYLDSKINNEYSAKFLLHNTTKETITILQSQIPGQATYPGYLLRPRVNSPLGWSNLLVSVGSHFFGVVHVPPNQNYYFEVPLSSGQPRRQAGISYFMGAREIDDVLSITYGTPSNATLLERAKVQVQNFKTRLMSAKRHEVWCSEWLCLPANVETTSTNNTTASLR